MNKLIRKLKCLMGYHKFSFKQKLSSQSMRVICDFCKCDMAVNMNMECALPYRKVKEFYEIRKKLMEQ